MKDNELGSELHPVKNNIELSHAIINKENCIIYTVKTFTISKENLNLIRQKNITLVGLAFAEVKYIPNKNKINNKRLNNIVFDEIHEFPFDIKVDMNLETNQKSKYLNGGM